MVILQRGFNLELLKVQLSIINLNQNDLLIKLMSKQKSCNFLQT